jgi:hypothetical protein
MSASPPLAGLRAALRAEAHPLADEDFAPLPDTGLAHWHVRLGRSGWLARLPKQSQLGLAAQDNLRYQAACFERAAAGGHAPRLHGVIAPASGLPRGALLVEAIDGKPLQLPSDLPAMIDALAALHRLPLPEAAARAPLQDPGDPLAALAAEIDAQATHLDAVALAPAARRAIDAELARWRGVVRAAARPPRRLIAFDAHPGNYLRRADGRAVLVDLEKMRYGAAALDLAHATLYTSTTWDRQAQAVLSPAQVHEAYAAWLGAVPGGDADRGWFAPLRRAMWLWSVSWCALWRVHSGAAPTAGGDGADWSAAQNDAALAAHVRDRVDHYLAPVTIERLVAEFDAFDQAWRGG